jgi:hypothetical protein
MAEVKVPISVLDVKNALKDENFRKSLPESLNEDVQKFLGNPNCSCNLKIYQKLMAEAKEQLVSYFPDKFVPSAEQMAPNNPLAATDVRKLAQNRFSVINCTVFELEETMQKLPPGRKQITMTRWEDQVTVLINELEVAF